jgi:branched-chain amino acid transport system substrate-binding protein
VAMAVFACSPGSLQFGSRTLNLPIPDRGGGTSPAPLVIAGAEKFGRGSVPVALLLPLSGDPATAQVGMSMANASKLAIAFIDANPNIGENITISLRDTGTTTAGAINAANAAVAEGAKLILGPLAADQVNAAGSVARASGIPMIGFSNTAAAAGPGVYLLSVLPEGEMKRSVLYLRDKGLRGPAGVFPATPYGEAQATAFRQQAIAAGFSPTAVYTFSSAEEARQIVAQAKPLIDQGRIDALFIPDRGTAPTFGTLLAEAGVTPDMVQLVGSAEWGSDNAILASPALQGAIFPSVDPSGYNAIAGDYQARFGGRPHPLATIAYTATILANVNTLSLASPPYNPGLMTTPAGFNGRDGVFRFLGNGRSEYGLAIMKIGPGGASVIEPAKL